MNKQHLTDNYAIPGVLAFDENEHGLIRALITTAACSAEIYLQGAHLTQWHPAGHKPVLFLSERSGFLPGMAIRGGVPIIFPWFGARTATPYSSRTDGPSHGFARTSDWQLASATVDGDAMHLTLTLGPTDTSRSLGYDHFLLTYKLTIGTTLALQLRVDNFSQSPMLIEEALHCYFLVGDAKQITIGGLVNSEFLDKADGFERKIQKDSVLEITGETDGLYINTEARIDLNDPTLGRRITIDKLGSKTTVVWNPWSELTAKLADMSSDDWLRMACVETANAVDNAVTLAPGAQHTMQADITLKAFD
jgi:glucose-6-phosphate 1-epimerase